MSTDHFNRFMDRLFQHTPVTSAAALARVLGIHPSAISQARRKNAVPAAWLLALFRRFDLNPDWLEQGTGPVHLRPFSAQTASGDHLSGYHPVPKVSARLCAGGGSFDVSDAVQGHQCFEHAWLQRKGSPDHMVLLDVFGNSMTPEIKDGDTVLIDRSMRDVLAGAVYAVGIEDTIMVKRLERHPRKLVLLSDNKDYAPIYLSDEEAATVRVIGKVLWICRELR